MLDAMFDRSQAALLVFREAKEPGSPAALMVDRALDGVAQGMLERLAASEEDLPSHLVVKALLVACQWIVEDAIRSGLSDEARAEAKRACWDLAARVFGLGNGTPGGDVKTA